MEERKRRRLERENVGEGEKRKERKAESGQKFPQTSISF